MIPKTPGEAIGHLTHSSHMPGSQARCCAASREIAYRVNRGEIEATDDERRRLVDLILGR